MVPQDIRNLQEAYLEVYSEDFKPLKPERMRQRMGQLERQLPQNYSYYGPEYSRYSRVANVTKQANTNPNKPFEKPKYDPNLSPKGLPLGPAKNPQWQPFSSRLPNSKNTSTNTSTPRSSVSSTSSSRTSTPSSSVSTTSSRPSFRNRLSGSLGSSSGLKDRMGEYRADLKSISPRSARYTPGGRYGIGGIGLADEYDLYDIILSHLLDEGYAETPESAKVIMVNMSEEWRESIVEADIEPPRERVGALTNIDIPSDEREAARQRILAKAAKAKAMREKKNK